MNLRVAMAAILGIASAEAIGCRVAVPRLPAAVIGDNTSDGVPLAEDTKAFAALISSPQSDGWQLILQRSGISRGTATRSTSLTQIKRIPNGKRVTILDRRVYVNGRFEEIPPSSLAERRSLHALEVVRVVVREGPQKGVEGWTSAELVQHENGIP